MKAITMILLTVASLGLAAAALADVRPQDFHSDTLLAARNWDGVFSCSGSSYRNHNSPPVFDAPIAEGAEADRRVIRD